MKTINVFLIAIFSLFFISQNGYADPLPGQSVYLQSKLQSNRFLAPKEGSWSNGAFISIHSKARASDRACQWKLQDAGHGYFYLALSNGKVMDVRNADRNHRVSIWLYAKNGTDAQKFKFVDAGNGYYFIVPKLNSSLRLDVKNAERNEGTEIWTYPGNNTDAQKWKIIDVNPPRTNEVKSISKLIFAGFTNDILGKMKIRMNNHGVRHRDRNDDVTWYKKDDSYIEFEGQTQRFDIPEFTRGVRDKKSYLMDMQLKSVETKFESNSLALFLRFEENAAEIKSYCSNCAKFREDSGASDYQLINNLWKVKLKIVPYGGSVTYTAESVKFLGNIDGAGFGEFMEPMIKNSLIPILERNIKSAFQTQRVRISSILKNKAATIGLNLENVNGVGFIGNEIIFRER